MADTDDDPSIDYQKFGRAISSIICGVEPPLEMGRVEGLLFLLLTPVLCFGVSFFSRLFFAMTSQTTTDDLISHGYSFGASDGYSWLAAIAAGGFIGALAALRHKCDEYQWLVLITFCATIGLIFGVLGVVGAIDVYYNPAFLPSLWQTLSGQKPPLMECVDNSTMENGIGKLCTSKKECVDYVKLARYPINESNLSCQATSYVKTRKNGEYISCKSDEDCYIQFSIMSYDSASEISLKEIEKTIRCNNSFCENTQYEMWSDNLEYFPL
jgi:hypothetical protein